MPEKDASAATAGVDPPRPKFFEEKKVQSNLKMSSPQMS